MGNANGRESQPGGDGARRPSAADERARARANRAELSFLGLATTSTRDRERPDAPFERRETRQEREARKLDKERVIRAKERERSLQEEHVDGGYLVTLGTYTGTEDFSKPIVRGLQIERRIAPFWRGLNDWSNNWAEHQLIAADRGLPIPAADETPDPELLPRPPPPNESGSSQNLQNLTVPLGERTLSTASDHSGSAAGSGVPTPVQTKSSPFKPRAKALAAALSGGSRNSSSTDLGPKEVNLPHDPFVNGQALEVFLYKDATECPICFLTYPPYLNQTRCCDQSLCTECFVQIKRADPHLPEHHPNGQTRDPNEGLNPEDPPEMLMSEPAACPYCQQPEFGVTYAPPPFRRGLVHGQTSNLPSSSTAMSSQSSLHSSMPASPAPTGRRRTQSLSANAPGVITTDRVRPDWATKLASARSHQARRAAAATALHTAAFLAGGENDRGSLLRPGRFSRRNTGNNSSAASLGRLSSGVISEGATGEGETERGTDGGRRSRVEELEDMMFMEAVRLSLAAEEERKKKEDKIYRKEAKKREKEEKKAARKQGSHPYGGSTTASGSSLSLGGLGRRRGNSTTSNLRMEATVQSASQVSKSDDISPPNTAKNEEEAAVGKGKEVERGGSLTETESPEPSSEPGTSASLAIPTPSTRPSSHLRQMSNASSIGSSLDDTPCGSYQDGHIADRIGNGRHDESDNENGTESMFNFTSLAEIVGVDFDNGTVRRDDSETTGRPLSQVKEEADAEHVEDNQPPQTLTIPFESTEEKTTQEGDSPTPELKITPVTPAADDDEGMAENKQLGHSTSVMEQAPHSLSH